MMIGIFHSAQDSFTGQIRTLMLDAVVTLVPAPSNDSDNAPDWRVLLGDAETALKSVLAGTAQASAPVPLSRCRSTTRPLPNPCAPTCFAPCPVTTSITCSGRVRPIAIGNRP
jgi:hypothetical protein